MEGDVLGTPAYMPPEQASGKVDEIDARSDVFALGGILYSILTHEAPFDGDTVYEVLSKAQAGTVIPPRRRTPWNRIPPELESICLKAMAPKKRSRYFTVEALVEDVRAYLDRRPVSAHRYGPLTRFVRFVQRHPAGSLAGGVALVLVSVGGALTGILWSAAQANAARANEQEAIADASSARAEAEALRAEKAERDRVVAVDRADTAEATLEKGRRVSAVLRSAHVELGEVLRELNRYYYSADREDSDEPTQALSVVKIQDFERTVPGDTASQSVWLAAKGWLTWLSGGKEEALRLFSDARKQDPDVAYGLLFEGLTCLTQYLLIQPFPAAVVRSGRVKFEEIPPETAATKELRLRFESILEEVAHLRVWGESSADEFLEVLDGFRAMQDGDLAAAESGLTKGLSVPEMVWVRGEILLARAKIRYLSNSFREGLKDMEKVLELHPESFRANFFHGQMLSGIGYKALAEEKDPRPYLNKAIKAFDESIRRKAGFVSPWINRGVARMMIGQWETGLGEDPRTTYQRAIGDFREILRLDPERREPGINLGTIHCELGSYLASRGEPFHASFRSGIEVLSKLLMRKPNDFIARYNRGTVFEELGTAQAKRRDDPEESLRNAIRDYTDVLKAEPAHHETLQSRSNALFKLGLWMSLTGKDGREWFQRALVDSKAFLELAPTHVIMARFRGIILQELARAECLRGNEISSLIEAAFAAFDSALKTEPAYGKAHQSRGILLERLGRFQEALEAYEKAGRTGGPSPAGLTKDHQRAKMYSTLPAWAQDLYRCQFAFKMGDLARARMVGERGLLGAKRAGVLSDASYRTAFMDHYFRLSRILALLSSGRRGRLDNPKPIPPAGAEALASKAIESLRKSVEFGWTDLATIRRLGEFDPLRNAPEFKALVRDLEGKEGK